MSEEKTVVNFTIDGQKVSVPKGTTVYKACTDLGLDIPIFCYQDRMPPFGACRVCLVEVEKMPKLQTSCTLVATEGMVVHTQSGRAEKGREEILELLLINHPLDCPICDKGGECPLQDQAYKFGPGKSHFYEEKRHFKKPIFLGPVLTLDRERCIVCARCTRFGDLVAGDHALELLDRGYRSEVGTPHGGPAESKFIGNTIEICPVGALTSTVYRFRARPWDNKHIPSTCTLCPVGCSLIFDERDGEILRTRSCENKNVNDMWLCDKGWFGYEFAASDKRLLKPLIRRNGKLEKASWEEALSLIASKIKAFKPNGKLAGWGGNPLTTEENSLFQKLMREVCGVDHVDHRIGTPIFTPKEEVLPPGMEMSIGECENLTHVYLLGLDLTEEFPVIWLRLKQAINKGAKVTFVGHYAPEIAPYMSEVILHPPGQELENIKKLSFEEGGAIFVGSQYLRNRNRGAILSHLSSSPLNLNIMEGSGNSMGARLAGMYPGESGFDALKVLETASKTGWDFLYVAGANPALKFPSKLWSEARRKTSFLVVQDIFMTETADLADVVLPTLSYVEKRGTFINIEGRLQPLLRGKELLEGVKTDGEIFIGLAEQFNISLFSKENFLNEKKKRTALPEIKPQDEQVELAATFSRALFDKGVRMRHNKHLLQMAKKPTLRLHPAEGEKRGLKMGDRVLVNGLVLGTLELDGIVSEGTIVLPLGFPELPMEELGPNLMNGLPITLEKVHP
jgi:NADH-quinone oxidoreductase subunit G